MEKVDFFPVQRHRAVLCCLLYININATVSDITWLLFNYQILRKVIALYGRNYFLKKNLMQCFVSHPKRSQPHMVCGGDIILSFVQYIKIIFSIKDIWVMLNFSQYTHYGVTVIFTAFLTGKGPLSHLQLESHPLVCWKKGPSNK